MAACAGAADTLGVRPRAAAAAEAARIPR